MLFILTLKKSPLRDKTAYLKMNVPISKFTALRVNTHLPHGLRVGWEVLHQDKITCKVFRCTDSHARARTQCEMNPFSVLPQSIKLDMKSVYSVALLLDQIQLTFSVNKVLSTLNLRISVHIVQEYFSCYNMQVSITKYLYCLKWITVKDALPWALL